MRNLEGVDLLTRSRGNNLYTLSLRDMMRSSPICILLKASNTKSWLWHRRLSHLNFSAINHLARHDLVWGLAKLKFENDYLCSACAMGKSKKKPHKPKSDLVIVVDITPRFNGLKCLKSKDEAPDFIIKFLKMIQVRFKVHVQQIRTDNGSEFVNQTLREYYENVGISHETSVSRSPQQNGVVERRNHTLIEAARTMLIYANQKLIFFMADKERSCCYCILHQKIDFLFFFHPYVSSFAKTPYELLHDKLPDLLFFHVFGALCYLKNDDENFEDNHDLDVVHMNNDPFFGIPIPENDSEASSSSNVIPTIVHTVAPNLEHVTKWTKDHPLDNIIGKLERPVSTRLQLHEQALFCYYTSVEPKNYKDALTQACWIEEMQEELIEF
ncbi:retrovirus-related pol polyprotein from transposon TNT 1-94 [Tanacetum coccineum]